MAWCPKCKAAMGQTDIKCSKCGYDFKPPGDDVIATPKEVLNPGTVSTSKQVLGLLLGIIAGAISFVVICWVGLWFCGEFCRSIAVFSVLSAGILVTFAIALKVSLAAGRYAKAIVTGSTPLATQEPTVRHLVSNHAIPLVVVLLLLCFIPWSTLQDDVSSGENKCGQWYGNLSFPTQFCGTISDILRTYWFVILPTVAAFLWIDVRYYQRLQRHGSRRAALLWFKGIYYIILSLIPIVLWACVHAIFVSLNTFMVGF